MSENTIWDILVDRRVSESDSSGNMTWMGEKYTIIGQAISYGCHDLNIWYETI